jgi:drug/metabolite transporter (DMT)-like permease
VARLPVALALLAFNTWPMWTALWARVLYGHRPERRTLLAMPVLLVGLALALDVFGAASGLGAQAQWSRIGAGVAFALLAAATFGVVMVTTQHEIAAIDGRLRSAITMAVVGVLALGVTQAQGGLQLPHTSPGWWGLVMLTRAVRHRLHHHVHAAAAAGRGGLVAHPQRRAAMWPQCVLAWALLG